MEPTIRIGTLTFLAGERADVFSVLDVYENGVEQPSDETLTGIDDPQFDSTDAWVTGRVPMMKPVDVEGDTGLVRAWFQNEQFLTPTVITLYIEYEEAEELIANEPDVPEQKGDDCLEPNEIIL